jgi:hypothetical protein
MDLFTLLQSKLYEMEWPLYSLRNAGLTGIAFLPVFVLGNSVSWD